jgi:hypothetical protein
MQGKMRRDGAIVVLSFGKEFCTGGCARRPEWGKLKDLYCVKSVTRKRLVETKID